MLYAWQERVRNPSLTALLVLQLFLMFFALPMRTAGVPIVERISQPLLLVTLSVVVILSHRPVAIVIIAMGLSSGVASLALGRGWPPIVASILAHGGFALAFAAVVWVVGHAVYAPGRITSHRLQGAVIVYLSIAMIFAEAFGFLWELVPGAFSNLPTAVPGPREFATMLYFSVSTLTTTGYGDIAPVDPFARSLSNLEGVVGQFYLAITVARLVTLEMADRRHRGQ